MDKKYKSLVIWLLFQCSFRDPSFSFPSDAICSYSLLRIWKAHSKPAHFHVFLQALLTFPNLYLCASFRLSTVAGRSTFKYLLGYSFFFQNNFKVYLTMKFTRKLGNILTAGAGTISYDVEQYYIFVSFFLFFIFFSVCAYPSVVSYFIFTNYIVCVLHIKYNVFTNCLYADSIYSM